MSDPAWRKYEKHVLSKIREWVGPNAKIEYDVKLPGTKSGGKRQIDILVTTELAGLDKEVTIAIDCKCYGKNIDVGHADSFVSLVEDVQTDFGYLITNRSWSKTAEQRLERAMRIRRVPDAPSPRMSLALIDYLPPITYPVEYGEDHYSGEFWDLEPTGGMGAMILYNYVERESRYPIDHPDQLEWLDFPVASGPLDEVNWSNDAERRECARLVLRHYLSREPSADELESFVLEVAAEWEDGQLWSIDIDEIRSRTGLWANITET